MVNSADLRRGLVRNTMKPNDTSTKNSYKDTVNLPKTGFPMRANLPKREPETLEQWEALKIHYPLLWEEMRLLASTLEYKEYKGDSTRRRFLDYWRKHAKGTSKTELIAAPVSE